MRRAVIPTKVVADAVNKALWPYLKKAGFELDKTKDTPLVMQISLALKKPVRLETKNHELVFTQKEATCH